MGELLWGVIVQKCPEIAASIENKIAEEVGKKQAEIDTLNTKLVQAEADNIIALEALAEVYEMIIGGI